METERVALNQRERDCIRVLHEVKQGHLTQVERARRLQRCGRQVRRPLLRIDPGGDGAVVHTDYGAVHRIASCADIDIKPWCGR